MKGERAKKGKGKGQGEGESRGKKKGGTEGLRNRKKPTKERERAFSRVTTV